MSKDWKERFRQEDLQRLRGLRLMDDDFMSKCFEENIECTELVLRIVLDRDDLKVEKVAIQHQIKNLQGRSIIFDIYATDYAGKRYNVEIQRADRGAGAKRARYHSSLIDANVTEPGEKLENLVETYVIFITERDVLGKGQPIYHIDRVIKETGENFDDEAHILYVNGAYRDESPIGNLMHDFSCTDAKNMKYRTLAERVRYFKEDEKGVAAMCKAMEDMRNEADFAARKKTAFNMLSLGKLSYEEIASCTELSLEEIKALAEKKEA
ncbi:MAG: PD-(D/E)XK nuclease family transposase [Lachnospiraceae bacterium]|nr:PD-(D/E)XK nuclease family transposase [Lachnospiraceae bacterium]